MIGSVCENGHILHKPRGHWPGNPAAATPEVTAEPCHPANRATFSLARACHPGTAKSSAPGKRFPILAAGNRLLSMHGTNGIERDVNFIQRIVMHGPHSYDSTAVTQAERIDNFKRIVMPAPDKDILPAEVPRDGSR